MSVFGERLKKLRTAQGLTQAQLAKEFLTTQDKISRLEKGKAFDCDIICSTSKYFGVSADYLLGLTDVAYSEYAIDVDGFFKKCKESADTVRKCLDKLMKNDKTFDYQAYAFFETQLRIYEYDIPGLVEEYLKKRSGM